ncbi:tetratricopeptide repeat protein [Haloferula sp. A504]|uniref:tetratricopeptide repeat protein n=1 Tax=Haloferula sp. A504 TaxID=3373601 RepID=UPI0031C8D4CB|nr:tetratricopeptide repeat protein [Verrucomicrobiaceae bacterium E54]
MAELPHDIRFALDEFDRNQLPQQQRALKGEAFQEAVREYFTRQFAPHGGAAQIAISEDLVILQWVEQAEPVPLTERAADQLREGDTEKGIAMLRVALKRNPDDPDALFNLGMALGNGGQTEEAVQLLGKLTASHPDYPGGNIALGVACGRAGRWDEAIAAFRVAVERDAQDGLARKNLGAALAQNGRVEEGLEHLKAAVVLLQDDPEAWLNIAMALEQTGVTDEAETAYRRVISLDKSGTLAGRAEQRLTRIASDRFTSAEPPELREEAVAHLVEALKRFATMTDEQVRDLTFEIAMLGSKGLSIRNREPVHTLRNLPGKFSGLELLCLEYAGFQRIDPSVDIGIDLSAEYAEARRRADTR